MFDAVTVMSKSRFREAFIREGKLRDMMCDAADGTENPVVSHMFQYLGGQLAEHSMSYTDDGTRIPHRLCTYFYSDVEKYISEQKEGTYDTNTVRNIVEKGGKILNYLTGVDTHYNNTPISGDGWGYYQP